MQNQLYLEWKDWFKAESLKVRWGLLPCTNHKWWPNIVCVLVLKIKSYGTFYQKMKHNEIAIFYVNCELILIFAANGCDTVQKMSFLLIFL